MGARAVSLTMRRIVNFADGKIETFCVFRLKWEQMGEISPTNRGDFKLIDCTCLT